MASIVVAVRLILLVQVVANTVCSAVEAGTSKHLSAAFPVVVSASLLIVAVALDCALPSEF